jgi:hypothetical protein
LLLAKPWCALDYLSEFCREKSSIVALATLAAVSSTAFAQSSVTLSGKFGYQYATTTSNAGVKANGFNTTDGDVNFAVVEDLGGGLKAEAFMGIRLRGREINADSGAASAAVAAGAAVPAGADQADGIGARDSRITLSGGFGSVTVGAVAAGSGIIARGTAGQAGYNGLDHDGTLLDAEVNGVDLFQYTTPTFSGFNAYIQVVDSVGDPGAGGLQAAAATVSGTVVGLNYAAGPLSANIDTTSYDRNASTSTADSRLRMSAQYNLGMAVVGFGYQTNDNTATDVKQTVFGVSVPMGALSIGAAMVTRDTKTLSTGASVENKGYEIVANYNLSKRTSIAASYRTVNEGDKTIDQKATRVRLMHAF